MEKGNILDTNTVTTKQAVSKALGIPIEYVKAFKKLGCPAAASSGRYYLKELSQWYEEHKNEVIKFMEDNQNDKEGYQKYNTELKKWQSVKAKLEVDRLKSNSLDKEDVRMYIRSMHEAIKSLLTDALLNDLNPKLEGKNLAEREPILRTALEDICNKFNQANTDAWVKGKK
jgi:phage terminase Nu1 subunit (DNA packaging protein)